METKTDEKKIEEKLVEILNILETDLKEIDSAVGHLSKSKEAVHQIIESNNDFSIRFKGHMNELEVLIKSILDGLDSDTKTIIENWNEYSSRLGKLVEKLERLSTYFESVNFPVRLDKIDASGAALGVSMNSLKDLVNDLYRRADQNNEKIIEKQTSAFRDLDNKNSSNTDKIITNQEQKINELARYFEQSTRSIIEKQEAILKQNSHIKLLLFILTGVTVLGFALVFVIK